MIVVKISRIENAIKKVKAEKTVACITYETVFFLRSFSWIIFIILGSIYLAVTLIFFFLLINNEKKGKKMSKKERATVPPATVRVER